MKAHLLYPTGDVDFTIVRERGGYQVAGAPLPSYTRDLAQDLGLGAMLAAMSRGDWVLHEIAKRVILTSVEDPGTIHYRQAVLADCVRQEPVVREILRIVRQAVVETPRSGLWAKRPESVLREAVGQLQSLVVNLKRLRALADENAKLFRSPGFATLFATLQAEVDDNYFEQVDDHLRRLRFAKGVVVSSRLGQGLQGAGYVLRSVKETKVPLAERLGIAPRTEYHWELPPRDEAGSRAISELRDRVLASVAEATSQSADHLMSFFVRLWIEVGFYVSCLNLLTVLRAQNRPVCYPEPLPAEEKSLRCDRLCDACLALQPEVSVVGNEVRADGKALIIVTGANSGGKSTFLRSVGLAQLMMQSGMFVVADSYTASVHPRIISHFIREEDATMTSGKLDEELSRMSAIADLLVPGSLVLFNESFGATNEREGSEIAAEIVSALVESEVTVVFVTHQFTLANRFYRDSPDWAMFLRADRKADGERTFRLSEGRPLPTGFGRDLYQHIGGWGSSGVVNSARAIA